MPPPPHPTQPFCLYWLPHLTGQGVSGTLSARQPIKRTRSHQGPPLSCRSPYCGSPPHSVFQSHAHVSRSAASELPWQQARVFLFVFFFSPCRFFFSLFLSPSLSLSHSASLCLVTCIFKGSVVIRPPKRMLWLPGALGAGDGGRFTEKLRLNEVGK